MKVGILTFHDGINHGAFLQAFSTYKFLQQNGFEAEIINYKNRFHNSNELKAFLLRKNPVVVFFNILKIVEFKKDQKSMNLQEFTTDIRKISPGFDAIVVGSDVVWNYSDNLLGNDPVYFGVGLNCKNLVSYAASFGSVSEDDLRPEFVVDGLKTFKSISVRDVNSANIVESITHQRPLIVIDPTFLIDFCTYEKPTSLPKDKYILIYAYRLHPNEIDSIVSFAKKNSLKIISIGYKCKWADKNVIALGPFEWLSYFKHASYILTSTFHGTIFSIKYRKIFSTSLNENNRNKTVSLLDALGLQNRAVEGYDPTRFFADEINYESVEQLLSPLIELSQQYLIRSIGEQ